MCSDMVASDGYGKYVSPVTLYSSNTLIQEELSDPKLKQHFFIQHTLYWKCEHGHEVAVPQRQFRQELDFCPLDLYRALTLQGKDSTTISLNDYIKHSVPRRSGNGPNGASGLVPLHLTKPINCTYNSCTCPTSKLSHISTIWPFILHVPEPEIAAWPNNVSYTMPHNLTIPTQFGSTDPASQVVTYQLIGKIIYHSSHYTAQILIPEGDTLQTYLYNDMERGVLKHLGDEAKIDEPPSVGNNTLFVYQRTSSLSVVSISKVHFIENTNSQQVNSDIPTLTTK